ncbi:MAG: hypothetical protein ACU0CO_16265 [Shimia sp.]
MLAAVGPVEGQSSDGSAGVGRAPLSAIDWLGTVPPEPPSILVAPPAPAEPPVARTGTVPLVEAQPLAAATRALGLLAPSVTGLPIDVWSTSEAGRVAAAFEALPAALPLPLAEMRQALLLSQALPPIGASDGAFLAARVQTLRDLGAVEVAHALALTGDPTDPVLFGAYMDLALLLDRADPACGLLAADPRLSPDLALRVFCLARGGDWSAAALTLRSGEVLGGIAPDTADLLARFLDPELAGDPSALPPLREVTPLTFRLRSAIGAPPATGDLVRAYAVTDLAPSEGWKTRLDAGERLARTGGIGPAPLMALYTERVPAASGSVWDRAESLQRLDLALRARDTGAVAQALPRAVAAFSGADLEPQLAAMVADRIDPTWDLPKAARTDAMRLLFLSRRYEAAAGMEGAPALWAALARGDVSGTGAASARDRALIEGFSTALPDREGEALAGDGHLGRAILRGAALLSSGDHGRIAQGLALFRALGLEDEARRTALHLAILG